MPSFDVVSRVDMQEADNAVNQTIKEIQTRYDFKNSKSRIEFDKKTITIHADDTMKLKAITEILNQKMVKRGVPVRDAHAVVGRLVAHCLNENKALLDLSLEELKQFHPAFEADVFDDLSMLSCVEKRRIPGAPAPDMVQAAIDEGRKSLEENA